MIASFKAPKNHLSLPSNKVVGKHIEEVLPPQLALCPQLYQTSILYKWTEEKKQQHLLLLQAAVK